MITVYKNNKLKHKNKIYNCSLGINGLTKKKVEGDGCTPIGIFSLGHIFYRIDRVKELEVKKKLTIIKKNMFWSDDPSSEHYNKLILYKSGSCEELHRKDSIYDILVVINFNIKPIHKGKGSAIFLHVAKKGFAPTKGCIGLEKNDLLDILRKINKYERIKITSEIHISA